MLLGYDLKIYIRVLAMMESGMDTPHDILGSSIDLNLPVFRIPASRQLRVECRMSKNL